MSFIKWWEENGKEMRKTWVMLGAFALPTIAKAAWDAALQDQQIKNLIKIAEAVAAMPFGENQALPWCRESFPELDIAMKEYEEKYNKSLQASTELGEG